MTRAASAGGEVDVIRRAAPGSAMCPPGPATVGSRVTPPNVAASCRPLLIGTVQLFPCSFALR